MSSLLMESLGWALLHSLWQGAMVALLLAVALATVGRRAAPARYGLACGALMLSLALPVFSGWRNYSEAVGTVRAPAVERGGAGAAPRVDVTVPEGMATRVFVFNDARPRVETPPDVPLLERVHSAVASHLRWLVLAWVAGVGLCSGRMTAEWVKLRRLARAARPVPGEWQERLDVLARRLGLGRAVRLLQSASVDVPAAVGWLSPVVLLPVSALSGLSTRQLEMVLAHELAHIRRHDFAVNLAQVLVETLLFYHPAVRWVSHVIRVEREHCCDDVAVAASGGAVSYARALTALEELRVLPTTNSPAMSALGGSLPERVRRLITAPTTRCSSRWVAGASVLTLASSLAVAAPLTSLVLGRAPAEVEAPSDVTAPRGNARVGSPPSPLALGSAGVMPPPAPPAAPGAPPNRGPAAPPAPPPAPGLPAGVSPTGAQSAPPAPVIAPIPGAVAAPAPAPKPDPRGSDDEDERTRVGAGQPLSVDQLVSLKVAGVTPARVKELESMGYTPTVANLVAMSHAGVTPEYAKEMSTRFGRKLDMDDLVQLKHLGVTPAYIETLKSSGVSTNDPEDLTQLRAVGVDAAYIQALGQRGLPKLAADDLVQLRAVGVTPDWLDRMREAGVQTKDVEELTQLRALGVGPEFLRELRDAGLKDLSIHELVRLRAGGVDAEFIRRMRDSRSK